MYYLNIQATLLHFQYQILMFENQLTLFLILKTPLLLHVRSSIYVLFEHTSNSSTLPVPDPYVREPTDFIPHSEDTSREVTQANISQNNGTAEDTKAQQRPKVVSLVVCRAHEGQLSAAPYSIEPTQLVSLKYLIPGRVAQSVTCLATEMQVGLQIQGSRVQSWPCPILLWRLIMK